MNFLADIAAESVLPREVSLPRVGSTEPAPGVLSLAGPNLLVQLDAIWPPILRECDEPDNDWVWEELLANLAYPSGVETVVLLNGDMAQGGLITTAPDTRHSLSALDGLPVYIEYVAIAPWNRREVLDVQLFRAVGPLLLGHAVRRSVRLGRQGRIALHSAFESSTRFYREALRLADRGYDSAEGMHLFEGDSAWAQAFLKGPPR